MKILAFDSSSALLSVALYDDQKKIGELSSDTGAKHSNVLVPMIENLLKKFRVNLSEVDVFAVGLGPGSFTGLRVGIATAQVLGYVLKKKIVGVSSLEAIARDALEGKNSRVAVALDARKSKVYGAVYERRGEKFKVVIKPALFDAKEFPGISANPKASRIAEGSLELIRRKRFINPFRLEPHYLYPRDCNVTLKHK
jgi:tRNA threonylcarbamoyladenosine biosynthesis protein TsaB